MPKCWRISPIPKATATARAWTGSSARSFPNSSPTTRTCTWSLIRNADAEKDFAHFEEQRETNVELLRGLPAEAGDRKAMHREAGQITLSQMLHEWALHDVGHIRQIADLVRARKYLAGAGPLGASYQLKP